MATTAVATACLVLAAAMLLCTCDAQRTLSYSVKRFSAAVLGTAGTDPLVQKLCAGCVDPIDPRADPGRCTPAASSPELLDGGGTPNSLFTFSNFSGEFFTTSVLKIATTLTAMKTIGGGTLLAFQCFPLSFYRITQLPTATSAGAFEPTAALPSSFDKAMFAANIWAPLPDDTVAVSVANNLNRTLEVVGLPTYFNDTVAENGAVASGSTKKYPAAPATDYTYELDPGNIIDSFVLSNLATTNNAWAAAILFYPSQSGDRVLYIVYKVRRTFLLWIPPVTTGYEYYGFEATFSDPAKGTGRRRLLQAYRVDRAGIAAARTTCSLKFPRPSGCAGVSCFTCR